MKKRIWELDALRGLCILGMLLVHFVYDLVELTGIIQWEYPAGFLLIKDWGGILFLLISGICVTLGSRSIRRGLIVFGCGMVITAATIGMWKLGMAEADIVIWFGVLHCLGVCMLLWPLFKKLPTRALALTGILMIAAGLWLTGRPVVNVPWLVPLGIVFPGFTSSDYFPLLPDLGFFLMGAVLGRTLYKQKTSLFPQVNEKNPVIGFLSLCGRYSLHIYLLHQPLLYGLTQILTLIKK